MVDIEKWNEEFDENGAMAWLYETDRPVVNGPIIDGAVPPVVPEASEPLVVPEALVDEPPLLELMMGQKGLEPPRLSPGLSQLGDHVDQAVDHGFAYLNPQARNHFAYLGPPLAPAPVYLPYPMAPYPPTYTWLNLQTQNQALWANQLQLSQAYQQNNAHFNHLFNMHTKVGNYWRTWKEDNLRMTWEVKTMERQLTDFQQTVTFTPSVAAPARLSRFDEAVASFRAWKTVNREVLEVEVLEKIDLGIYLFDVHGKREVPQKVRKASSGYNIHRLFKKTMKDADNWNKNPAKYQRPWNDAHRRLTEWQNELWKMGLIKMGPSDSLTEEEARERRRMRDGVVGRKRAGDTVIQLL